MGQVESTLISAAQVRQWEEYYSGVLARCAETKPELRGLRVTITGLRERRDYDLRCRIWLESAGKNYANVDCVVWLVPKRSKYGQKTLQLCSDPAYIKTPELRVGALDSSSRIEGQGYNKFLRTLAYHFMMTVCECHFLCTYAVSPITVSVLEKYFGFDVGSSASMLLDDELRELESKADETPLFEIQKHQKIDRISKNIRDIKDRIDAPSFLERNRMGDLLSAIRQAIEDGLMHNTHFNMILDLTNPKSRENIHAMMRSVISCDCPPCEKTPKDIPGYGDRPYRKYKVKAVSGPRRRTRYGRVIPKSRKRLKRP